MTEPCPVVLVNALKPLAKHLGKLLELLDAGEVGKTRRIIARARRRLARALPPEIAPLKRFEVVEEQA